MTPPIRRGSVYWIHDNAVELPPTTRDKRTLHAKRPYLVISRDENNVDEEWPIVLGFPISTATRYLSEFDVKLPKGTASLAEDCHVQVALIQPIRKGQLLDWIGSLPANDLEVVETSHLRHLGLVP